MDPLGDLLDGVRARTAAFCRAVLEPPWALRIADRAPLALAAALRGHAWIVTADRQVLLKTGDVAIVQGPEPYTVADDPGTPPSMIVHPDNRLTDAAGTEVPGARLSPSTLAPRIGSAGSAVLASGTYQVSTHVTARLLSSLPRVLTVPGDPAVLGMLSVEVARDEPGQQVLLDRLLDLALIATLRAWFAQAEAPGWYRAHGDPLVGPALRLVHEDPARPWTVASLAAAVGASRAAFARRFSDLVGQPPMAYVTEWRLDLAAEALRGIDATVASVARQVGYANAFAFTVAFKRVRGTTPREHRAG